MCRMLVRLEPLLGIYSDLVRYYLAVSLGAHRSTGKLLSILASIFTDLAQKVQTHPNLPTLTVNNDITGFCEVKAMT